MSLFIGSLLSGIAGFVVLHLALPKASE